MLQRKLTLVPSVALALVSASLSISTETLRASEKCLTAPNAPAPRDQHWYYRTDRTTNRQCWYLAPRNRAVRNPATQETKLYGSQLPLPPQVQSSRPAQNETALDRASDAGEPEANVSAPELAINWPQPAKSPGITTSFERETPRSTDLIAPTLSDYESRAIELATDRDKLREISERLARNRLTQPLFDIASYTRQLERAYTMMYERHGAGLPPEHLHVTG